MGEHEEKMPPKEQAEKMSRAVDEYIAKIKELGPEYGTLLAVSAPGDACLVGCQMPEDTGKFIQLVTVIVSWLAAQFGWNESDVDGFASLVAEDVKRHVRIRAGKESAPDE